MEYRKIAIGSLAISLALVLGFSSALAFSGNGKKPADVGENNGLVKPLKARNTRIVSKRSLPSPADVSGGKKPPEHSNAGGNGNDDGGNDKKEGAATGVFGASGSGDTYAVVVGIADYPGVDYDLRYTDDDAQEVVEDLRNIYGYSNVTALIDEEGGGATEATLTNIKAAVDEVKSKIDEKDDEVVFYFSGHGGDGNANDEDDEATDEAIIVHDGSDLVYLWDGQLKDWFSDIGTSRVVFGFDSCLAGGMDDVAEEGRVVVTATTETGTAYEFSSLKNGQFTYYFFEEGVRQAKADVYDHNDNGSVEESDDVVVEEAYDYAKESYHPRYKKEGPTIGDAFADDLLLGY